MFTTTKCLASVRKKKIFIGDRHVYKFSVDCAQRWRGKKNFN